MSMRIPFNRPSVRGKELKYIKEAVEKGQISCGGEFGRRCEQELSRQHGRRCLLVNSCTAALEISAHLLDIEPGDKVVLPSYTFVSTASAFASRGAQLIFADIRPDTLNLDESQLPGLLDSRVKAVVPVHYAGVSCEMTAIRKTCMDAGVRIIEDNAHGLFARYGDEMLGCMGDMGCLSFHETKNIICGEGGALLLADDGDWHRAKTIRDKGTNRDAFLTGTVDWYSWVDHGSSYGISDILAAFLLAQLEDYQAIMQARGALWQRYAEELSDWASTKGVSLPYVPKDCQQSFHMFYILMPTNESRDRMLAHLKSRGIWAVFHYVPLHSSPMGRRMAAGEPSCPVSEDISRRILRLPFYTDMTREDQDLVVGAIRESA